MVLFDLCIIIFNTIHYLIFNNLHFIHLKISYIVNLFFATPYISYILKKAGLF